MSTKLPDPLPTPALFFLESPLYTRYALKQNQGGWADDAFKDLATFSGPLDAVCLECDRPSIFHNRAFLDAGVHVVRFECTRNVSHRLVFVLDATTFARLPAVAWVMKIGQYPSLADLAQAQIGHYRKPLGEELYAELNRGIGLAAHGVGVGSFVYLRRVFEALLEAAELSKGITSASGRWDERIDAVADQLPSFLVKNKVIYSILSKGIHDLTEDECLTYFPAMRTGIELILDEKIEANARAAKIVAAEKELSALHAKIGNGATGGDSK